MLRQWTGLKTINTFDMKIILIPLFKYTLSSIIALYVLILTVCCYPFIVLWEFRLMTWNEYMDYNYYTSVNNPEDYISEMLLNESFLDTMVRWLNFNYAIFYDKHR